MKFLIYTPCANASKLPLLAASLASMYQQLLFLSEQHLYVRQPDVTVEVRVLYNSDDRAYLEVNDGHGLDTFTELFATIGVAFSVKDSPGKAVASLYLEALRYASDKNFDYLLKVDDDCLLMSLPKVIRVLSSRIDLGIRAFDYVSINFWDIVNNRGYPDWLSKAAYSEMPRMISEHGEKTLWCHRWVAASDIAYHEYSPKAEVNASLFFVKPNKLLADGNTISRLASILPGQRGLDKVIGESRLTKAHYFNTYAIHLGVYRKQLDGSYWNSFIPNYSIDEAPSKP